MYYCIVFTIFLAFFLSIYNFYFSCQFVISFMASTPINNKFGTIIKQRKNINIVKTPNLQSLCFRIHLWFNVLIEIGKGVYSHIVILVLSSNRHFEKGVFHECNPSCIQYEWWEILMSCKCIHLYMDDFAKNWLVKNLISLYKNQRENNK